MSHTQFKRKTRDRVGGDPGSAQTCEHTCLLWGFAEDITKMFLLLWRSVPKSGSGVPRNRTASAVLALCQSPGLKGWVDQSFWLLF